MEGSIASGLSETVSAWSKLLHYVLFFVVLTVIMLATGIGSIASWFWHEEG